MAQNDSVATSGGRRSPSLRRRRLLGYGALLGGSLAGGTPRRGGILVVGKTTEAPSLDPHWQNALSRSRVTQLMYSYLVQADPDMRIVPDLAEKWDISPDGKTYTFALRKGVKFHNGR